MGRDDLQSKEIAMQASNISLFKKTIFSNNLKTEGINETQRTK
jgi:hypothetical protein